MEAAGRIKEQDTGVRDRNFTDLDYLRTLSWQNDLKAPNSTFTNSARPVERPTKSPSPRASASPMFNASPIQSAAGGSMERFPLQLAASPLVSASSLEQKETSNQEIAMSPISFSNSLSSNRSLMRPTPKKSN